MSSADIVIILFICVAVVIICMPLVKRLGSKETCCGTKKVKISHKRLKHAAGTYKLHIEGMHCRNCERQITEAINNIEGLSCRVSLEKSEAIVSYEKDLRCDEVIDLLGGLGFLARKE